MSKTVPGAAASAEFLAELWAAEITAEIIETVRRNSRVVVPKVSGTIAFPEVRTEPDEIYPPWSNKEKT